MEEPAPLFSKTRILGLIGGNDASPDSFRTRMLRGAFWSSAGIAGNRIAAAATTVFLARILQKNGFGDYGTLQNAMSTFAFFAGMSLGAVAGRYVAQLGKTEPARAGRIVALTTMVSSVSGLVIMLATILCAKFIAKGLYNDVNLTRPLQLAAPMLFLGAINSVQINVLTGLENFRTHNSLQFLFGVTGGVLSIVCASMGGINGVALSLSLNAVLIWVIYRTVTMRFLATNGIRIDFHNTWAEKPMLWSFALPTFLSNMVLFPVYMVANAVLRRQEGWGQAEYAVYTAASQWCNLLLFIPVILVYPLLPILTQLYAAGQFARLSSVLKKTIGINLAFVSAGAAAFAAMSPVILWLYGKEFKSGSVTLWLMLCVAVFQSVTTMINNFLSSAGEMWSAFIFNTIWALILLITTFTMVPHFQSRGLAAAYVISYAILAIIQIIYCQFYFKKRSGDQPLVSAE